MCELADLGRQISLVYAAAINEALFASRLKPSDLAAIAAHGQTLFHDPPLTIQWLDPALLSAEVGCPVISDFRRPDCAAGGQGAPLVPFADAVLFRDPHKNRVLANIGGIANITFLPAGGDLQHVLAFDTGPGNCISDWLCRRFDPAGAGFDLDGRRASQGSAIQSVVDRMLAAAYFASRPPKSTDIPAMISLFEQSCGHLLGRSSLNDLLATACCITTGSLARAIADFLPAQAHEVILSGGGIHNAAMRARLQQLLAPSALLTSDNLGVPSQAKEALAFAILGAATLDGIPSNIPSATGASRPVVLGSITPRP